MPDMPTITDEYRDFLRARGIQTTARAAGLSRSVLQRVIRDDDPTDPQLSTVERSLYAHGYRLAIVPIDEPKKNSGKSAK